MLQNIDLRFSCSEARPFLHALKFEMIGSSLLPLVSAEKRNI